MVEVAGFQKTSDLVTDDKEFGGGGSRTRVRKHVVVGLYMRVRFWVLMPGVRKRPKTARHQTR